MTSFVEHHGLEERGDGDHGMTLEEWEGLRDTVRSVSAVRPHDIGRYGAEVRKRAKREAWAHLPAVNRRG